MTLAILFCSALCVSPALGQTASRRDEGKSSSFKTYEEHWPLAQTALASGKYDKALLHLQQEAAVLHQFRILANTDHEYPTEYTDVLADAVGFVLER